MPWEERVIESNAVLYFHAHGSITGIAGATVLAQTFLSLGLGAYTCAHSKFLLCVGRRKAGCCGGSD